MTTESKTREIRIVPLTGTHNYPDHSQVWGTPRRLTTTQGMYGRWGHSENGGDYISYADWLEKIKNNKQLLITVRRKDAQNLS